MVITTPPVIVLATPIFELIGFRVLRDGAVTPGRKYVRMSRNINAASRADAGLEALDGELTPQLRIPLQVLTDQPNWLVIVEDTTPPARAFAQTLEIVAAGVYTINISTGSGGEATDPALVDASVRVDRLPAVREVVVIERPATGEWRIAGRGQTDAAGLASIDLAVTGGRVFAMAVDDYGVAFSPGLVVTVGQRIRPSVFAGVLYEITEAGTLPATEPVWWPITVEDSRELGTGRAVARRYYRPLAHGPFPVELVDD